MSTVKINVYAKGIGVRKTDPSTTDTQRIEVHGELRLDARTRIFCVEVRLPAGDVLDSESVFEVTRPTGYDGPYDHLAFSEIVQRFVRERVPLDRPIENIGIPPFGTRSAEYIGSFDAETGSGGAW